MRRHRPTTPISGLLLALVVVGFGPAVSRAAGPASTLSEGEIHYHAYPVAYRHGSNEARADFSIRIPYSEIRFVPTDTLYEGRLRVTVELWDAAQKRVGYVQQEARAQVMDAAAASDSLLGEIYSLGIVEKPGKYHYRVTVEDMNVARMGLVYKMKNQKRQGRVEGDIDMGAWLFREPGLSGLEPAWQIGPRTENALFARGPYEVLPQPSRSFGLYKDAVSIYYEIYDAPPGPKRAPTASARESGTRRETPCSRISIRFTSRRGARGRTPWSWTRPPSRRDGTPFASTSPGMARPYRPAARRSST